MMAKNDPRKKGHMPACLDGFIPTELLPTGEEVKQKKDNKYIPGISNSSGTVNMSMRNNNNNNNNTSSSNHHHHQKTNNNHLDFEMTSLIALPLTFICGILMVSTLRYHSFKELDLRGKIPFVVVLILVLGLALVAIDPPIVLFAGFLAYAISGPIFTLTKLRQHKTGRQQDK